MLPRVDPGIQGINNVYGRFSLELEICDSAGDGDGFIPSDAVVVPNYVVIRQRTVLGYHPHLLGQLRRFTREGSAGDVFPVQGSIWVFRFRLWRALAVVVADDFPLSCSDRVPGIFFGILFFWVEIGRAHV